MLLVFLMTICNVSVPVQADSETVVVNADQDSIELANDSISRRFSIADGHIRTEEIYNKITGLSIRPEQGSQDFVINTIYDDGTEFVSSKHDTSKWKATLTAQQGQHSQSNIAKLFDGDVNTYIDASSVKGNPFTLTIDFGEELIIKSMSVNKRPGVSKEYYEQYPHGGIHGTMGQFVIETSEDGEVWTEVKSGEFTDEEWNIHHVGNTYNIGDTVYENLDQAITTRYIRVIQKSNALNDLASAPGIEEFTSAEISFYRTDYEDYLNEEIPEGPPTEILSSNLEYDAHEISDMENGKQLSIHFKPYMINGVEYIISEHYLLEADDHYIRSYLEINADDREKAQIDYIDTDRFFVNEQDESVWSKPDDQEITSAYLEVHGLMLGQPIYMNSFFMGSEFPAAETDIVDEYTQVRYYSGKTFAMLEEEGALDEDGSFITWNNVIGSATGPEQSVVQTAFYDYINDIATKSDFRKQYNSWYDSGKNISDSVLKELFTETEDSLSKQGVEPLDTYVSDDGWNEYDGSRNRTGFWELNTKFPNEFYTISSTANKLSSSFGIWISPHGGFGGSTPQDFSDVILDRGTGYTQSAHTLWDHVICTGSQKYINNFKTLITDYIRRFDIAYFKMDGFAMDPCRDDSHDHITGGESNMYYYTEKWERWIEVFEAMRAVRDSEGKGLWINATNHVNLSPWLLQWVNSVWVQDSGDSGTAGDASAQKLQRQIYYRDNVYHSLINQKQVQFPLKNIYNHDPIYTKSDNASADVFREFMIDNAMRGTAFWELYFSPSNMDEDKWMVTADILDFAETNHDVLQNAKLFVEEGKQPSSGVYGYSAWIEEKGFVSFVNPTASEKTYTLPLTDIYGVREGMSGFQKIQIFPYTTEPSNETVSYGEELTVTLAPFSTQVYQFGNDDHTAPTVVYAKITDENIVEIKFDERVNSDALTIMVDGETMQGVLQADYRTVEIDLAEAKEEAEISIKAEDMYGNGMDEVSMIAQDDEIASVGSAEDLNEELNEYDDGNNRFIELDHGVYAMAEKGVSGNNEFSISLALNTTDTNAEILRQGEDYRLYIDDDGYLNFSISGHNVSSREEVTTVIEKAHGTMGTEEYVSTETQTVIIGKVNDGNTHAVTVTRELNGLIKLYLDGELCASAYDEAHPITALQGEQITLGSENYDGFVSGVEIRNSSRTLEEIEDHARKYGLNAVEGFDRSSWTATACSQATDQVGTGRDGSAMDVLDGNNGTWWHSRYSNNQTACDHGDTDHWLKIDFGETLSFTSLTYTARPLTEKENGLWLTASVYGIDENGTETELIKDQEIKVDDARNYTFTFDSPQTFNGVKFVIDGNNGFATAAEINAAPVPSASVSDVMALKQHAKELLGTVNEEDYTTESYQSFKQTVDEIFVLNPFDTTVETYDLLAKELQERFDSLEEAGDLTDKSALQEAVENCASLRAEKYTRSTWENLTSMLEEAQSVLENESAAQDEVDQAAAALNAAMEALQVKASESALNALQNMVDKAITLGSDDEALNAAIDAAQALLSDPDNASVTAVVTALIDLSEAMQALNTDESTDALRADVQATIDFINENILTNVDNVRPCKVQALKDAVKAAQDVVNDPDATVDELKAANKAMTKAAQELWEIVTKAELDALIEAANGYLDGDYTAESLEALQTAIESAQAVAANDDATTAEVTEAITNLSNAIAGLESIMLDTSALEHEIDLIVEMLANLDNYVPSSVEGLADKLDDAQNVLENAASQAEIDEATKSLREARLNARTKADVSVLEELIAYVNGLELSAYMAESADTVLVLADRALVKMIDPEITQDEVDALAEELQSAIDELQPVSDATITTPDNTTDSTTADKTNTAATDMSGMMFALMAAAGVAAAVAYRRKRS